MLNRFQEQKDNTIKISIIIHHVTPIMLKKEHKSME